MLSYQSKQKERTGTTVQPKLKIGQPGDKYEQMADAVADRVMMMPEKTDGLQMVEQNGVSSINRKCAECEEEEKLQMKPAIIKGTGIQMMPNIQMDKSEVPFATDNLVQNLSHSKGSGTSMPRTVGEELGNKIGADFGNVKIHTDNTAVQMNNELNAHAFTYGNDIYFNKGKYNPVSAGGKHLLAHELTHVVQQNGGINSKVQMMSAADALTIAQGLNTTYPNWLDVLPDCPCTYDEAMLHPDVWKDSTSPVSSWFHPGAAHDVRSVNGYRTIPNSSHGQQCTYDDDGKLITSGPGAGTPDVWSPATNFWDHQSNDVETYNALGSNVYVRYWTPNNDNNCEANAGGGGNISLTPSSEAKIVEIRDLLYGWTSEADIQRIIAILASVTTPAEMQAIRFDISPLLVSYLSDIGYRTRIRVALVRL